MKTLYILKNNLIKLILTFHILIWKIQFPYLKTAQNSNDILFYYYGYNFCLSSLEKVLIELKKKIVIYTLLLLWERILNKLK